MEKIPENPAGNILRETCQPLLDHDRGRGVLKKVLGVIEKFSNGAEGTQFRDIFVVFFFSLFLVS